MNLESLSSDVIQFRILTYFGPFEILESSLLRVSKKWNKLVQGSLKNRKCGLRTWSMIRGYPNFSYSDLKYFVKIETFDMRTCSQTIFDFCCDSRRISKFWKIAKKISKKFSGYVKPLSGEIQLRIKLNYPMHIAKYWLLLCETPDLIDKFNAIADKKRTVVAIIDFAEFLEGHVDPNELSACVVQSMDRLGKGGSIHGILKLVEKPNIFQKVPAVFSKDIFLSLVEYAKKEHSLVFKKTTEICVKLLEVNHILPNFNPFGDEDLFQKIVDSRNEEILTFFFENVLFQSSTTDINYLTAIERIIKSACDTPDGVIVFSIIKFVIKHHDLLDNMSTDVHKLKLLYLLRSIPRNETIFAIRITDVTKCLIENSQYFPFVNIKEDNFKVFVELCRERRYKSIESVLLLFPEISKQGTLLLSALEKAIRKKDFNNSYHRKRSEFDTEWEDQDSVVQLLIKQPGLQEISDVDHEYVERILQDIVNPGNTQKFLKLVFSIPSFKKSLKNSQLSSGKENILRKVLMKMVEHGKNYGLYYFQRTHIEEGIIFLMDIFPDDDELMELLRYNVNNLIIYFLKCFEQKGFLRCFGMKKYLFCECDVLSSQGIEYYKKCLKLFCSNTGEQIIHRNSHTYNYNRKEINVNWIDFFTTKRRRRRRKRRIKKEEEEEEEGEEEDIIEEYNILNDFLSHPISKRIRRNEKQEILDFSFEKGSFLMVSNLLKSWNGIRINYKSFKRIGELGNIGYDSVMRKIREKFWDNILEKFIETYNKTPKRKLGEYFSRENGLLFSLIIREFHMKLMIRIINEFGMNPIFGKKFFSELLIGLDDRVQHRYYGYNHGYKQQFDGEDESQWFKDFGVLEMFKKFMSFLFGFEKFQNGMEEFGKVLGDVNRSMHSAFCTNTIVYKYVEKYQNQFLMYFKKPKRFY